MSLADAKAWLKRMLSRAMSLWPWSREPEPHKLPETTGNGEMSDADAATGAILTETTFTGHMVRDGEGAPITFRVSAGADCRLIFDCEPVSQAGYMMAINTHGEPGTTAGRLSLSGTSGDGKTFHSDHVTVGPHGFGGEGYWITVSATVATLTLPLPEPVGRPALRLWFRAFKSFRNPPIDTSLGRLAVQGEAAGVGTDDMSGCVTLEALSDDPGDGWRDEADAFLRHMHRGLAFAHGGPLQTPRLDYVNGEVWEATFYEGRGSTPELSVQHPLNQRPYIQALVTRYENDGPLPEILWTALGWMQVETTYDEVRFLTAMTAIETVVQHLLPGRWGTIIPKPAYRQLREDLKAVIRNEPTLDEASRDLFCGIIDQNNRKVLAQKIDALFDHYDLPRQDFERDTIASLVNTRNDIVHRGVAPDGLDLWPQIILARELIARILLRQIGFVGSYECYVGGYGTRDFPAPSRSLEE